MLAKRHAMKRPHHEVLDGNAAATSVAFRVSEVIAIYPITPASPMGELADEWAAEGRQNVWGTTPTVTEMQSEGGAAGSVHGALQAGALTTTFTASQGLLLMIPNLYKIAGELNAFCIHVAARTLATHALSIFGDHSDVMACRGTGFAMLVSDSPQQAHDLAAISHAATLRTRVPFMHFFDGFRTSHELNGVEVLDDEDLLALLDPAAIAAHRDRALSPDHPVIRGTAQNPDTFFQAREACNPFYDSCPDAVEAVMDEFAQRTGRRYKPFEYDGDPNAERVIVLMGSGAQTARETVRHLAAQGEAIGCVTVRLYRPFDSARFLACLPATTRRLAVLDRTKEPGAPGEPLYLDVLSAISEGWEGPRLSLSAGRYGLSSKEFTPAMVKSVFDALARPEPPRRFTVGIRDDVTHLSLPYDENLSILGDGVYQALFYGLGSDGTVGANKNTIKIVGEYTDRHTQGYFVYDSRKSGAETVSHVRFGAEPIAAPYLVAEADLVACHQYEFLERPDFLSRLRPGGVLLINAPYSAEEVWARANREVQEALVAKRPQVYVIDAASIARETGLGGRINTVMQVCFFAAAKIMPIDKAMEAIKNYLEYSYGKKGGDIVRRNLEAVDRALAAMESWAVPASVSATRAAPAAISSDAPDFVQRVTAQMLAGQGESLPVSAFPPDGTWPVGTTRWEKRNIAHEIPVWNADLCIQCNKCTFTCPHAAIRAKAYPESALEGAPQGFQSAPFRGAGLPDRQYTLQVAAEDCTGCYLCVEVCPVKDKTQPGKKALDMQLQLPLREQERERFAFFSQLPELSPDEVRLDVKHTQLLQPLFEFSGACAGCGETPYIKLLTQLFGDRALIANATGCSSIYGGNLPTTPYTTNAAGRGPAWANSLFEDNAEFGLGFRLAVDALGKQARFLLRKWAPRLDVGLVDGLLAEPGRAPGDHVAQRARVEQLKTALTPHLGGSDPSAAELHKLADYLVQKSVWIVGGDGWAYDIGFGGLDHVLASDADVNILVLDTEVYSNTGGQQSKATPLGAAAKFAAGGKTAAKKDLGLIAMTYEHAYVARVAFGARDQQTFKAFLEAEQHRGPSLIIAYSHCIAHGYDLKNGLTQQKLAVDSGVWPLYRYDPARIEQGEPPLHLDSNEPTASVADYMRNEARFRMLERIDPERFKLLQEESQLLVRRRTEHYRQLADLRTTLTGPVDTKE